MSSIILETILYDAEKHLPGLSELGTNVVLVRVSTNFFTLGTYQRDRKSWLSTLDGKPIPNVTHWMYLPRLGVEKYRLIQHPDPIPLDES